MRKLIISLTVGSISGLGFAAAAGEPARPMAEMHGDCANYRTNVSRDLVLWAQAPKAVVAGNAHANAPAVSVETRLEVVLKPHPDVSFAAAPEQMRGAAEKFSGLLKIRTSASGAYRVSAGSGLWVDIVGPQGLVPSRTFEMQTKCDRIFKTVTYDLPANSDFIVQLNGGTTATERLLIHRVEP